MSISKTKINKIIGYFFLFLILISFFLPFKNAFAEDPTLTFDKNVISTQDATTKKWQWVFTIRTTRIPSGSILRSVIYKDGIGILFRQSTINNSGVGYFATGYILETNTKYKVLFALPDTPQLTKDYEGTAGEAPPEPDPIIPPATPPVNTETMYKLLAPLPLLDATIDTKASEANPCPFGKYLNILIKLFFGICGVLAVVMIVMGGIQYMTSDLVSSKEAGKESIRNAILGLLLGLGAWLILNTINPDLLNSCLNSIPPVEITIDEAVTDAGSGVLVDGNLVKISNGSAVNCTGGIVSIPSSMGSGQICKDLLDRLQILKSKMPGWKINSTIRNGGAASSCHYSNSANSGNCADLQITNNPNGGYTKENGSTNITWGDFCVAVAQTGGLNFLNEASRVINCENIIKYKAYSQTTGPHLHVNYIGGGGGNVQKEVYSSVSYTPSSKTIMIILNNYLTSQNHKAMVSNNGFNITKNPITALPGTNGYLAIGLTEAEYNQIKGTTQASVSVWSAGVGLGTKDLLIP